MLSWGIFKKKILLLLRISSSDRSNQQRICNTDRNFKTFNQQQLFPCGPISEQTGKVAVIWVAWNCWFKYFQSTNTINPTPPNLNPNPKIKKKNPKGSMRVLLEMTEQQQIINVWSCTCAICKFIFFISDHSGYFLVAERSDVQKIFARPLNSQNNKLSYQRVDMFEFDIILCFIVLLILPLPTPILFFVFVFVFSKKTNTNKKKRNVGELNKNIGK